MSSVEEGRCQSDDVRYRAKTEANQARATAAITTREVARGQARRPRLKVFQAQFGFYDAVVAAPSQAVALRALRIHQNRFANFDAKETATAVAAALEHPERLLRQLALGREKAAVVLAEPAGLSFGDNSFDADLERSSTGKPSRRPTL